MELMMFSKNLTSVTGNMTPYVTAAIFYLIVTLPLIKVVSTIEKRMAKSERGGGPRPKAKAKKTEVAEDEAQAVGTEPSLVEALSAPFKAGTSVMGGTADVR
jgi:polar amino acid transport system substrate-binding protein